ncbi:calcium-transporting ATPase 12, plasma membrane-type [Ziziphus jujuba]|uniref:Calcium-transporting ATPase 12, plasma membrane-type n=1 Tax=Ziziphus jujuba TaxID=326968 RepID=A0ABM3IJJ7_ZIZJJ|nr:calcium-transporting ATPase 12, plasma membrane-type [Ziziphus jujuba]
MSDTSSAEQHVDLESKQEKVLFKGRLRRFLLIIKVHRVFMSIPAEKLNKFAPRVSVSPPSSSSAAAANALSTPSYTAISSTAAINGDAPKKVFDILKDELSVQVSIEVHSDLSVKEEDCSRARDQANLLQCASIMKIVKDKDMESLRSFGGVRGTAEALCTHLELGISGDQESLDQFRYGGSELLSTTTQPTNAPRRGLFGYLRQYCNNCNILLLSLCALLSIGFGIEEEGWKTGWYEGAIIAVAIFILILSPFIRDFMSNRSQKILEMQKPIDETTVVIRDGCQKELLISNVVVGDVVCLTSGSPIPGDGLFIVNPGDDQVLLVVDHDGLESTVDEKTPFLFYGAKVINGNGRMLITSVGMDTVSGELMSKVSNTHNKTPLLAQLEKVGTITQIAGISISILILVVLFLRCMLEGKHTTNKNSAGLPELKNTAATKNIIDIIKKIAIEPCGKISPLTTSLAILLVGIQEPIPFGIILVMTYRRKKTFSCKVQAQELLACVTIGSTKIICTEKLYQPEVFICYVGEENIQKGCLVDYGVGTCVCEALCRCISTPILMPSILGRSIEDPLLPWAASELGMDMEILRQNSTIQEMKALSSD